MLRSAALFSNSSPIPSGLGDRTSIEAALFESGMVSATARAASRLPFHATVIRFLISLCIGNNENRPPDLLDDIAGEFGRQTGLGVGIGLPDDNQVAISAVNDNLLCGIVGRIAPFAVRVHSGRGHGDPEGLTQCVDGLLGLRADGINVALRDHLDEAHWINLGLAHGEADNMSIVIFGKLSR